MENNFNFDYRNGTMIDGNLGINEVSRNILFLLNLIRDNRNIFDTDRLNENTINRLDHIHNSLLQLVGNRLLDFHHIIPSEIMYLPMSVEDKDSLAVSTIIDNSITCDVCDLPIHNEKIVAKICHKYHEYCIPDTKICPVSECNIKWT